MLYAGNVGFSQSLEMVVDAAREVPEATFVINLDPSKFAEKGGAAHPGQWADSDGLISVLLEAGTGAGTTVVTRERSTTDCAKLKISYCP